jgi:HlyD family secretion protein
MAKTLFPPEILNYSAESYYAKLSIHSRIIYLSVLFFVIAAIASLPFIQIDVTTQSRGIIRSPMENNVIQSPVYGEVTTYLLHENRNVLEGDTLIAFNTERLDEQILLNTKKIEQNNLFITDIDKLLTGKGKPDSYKYTAEYNRYLSKQNEQKIQISFLQKDYETTQRLYEKSVVSEFEYLTLKNNYEKAQSLLNSLKEEFYANWQNEQTNLEIENQTIKSTNRQLEKEKRNYVITAPVSGTLVQVAGFQTGNFIAPNQVIAYISVSDSLLAECYIIPADIGYIREGQDVVFQFDAFDYREWGLIEGKVTEILKDIVTIDDNPVFRVRCRLNSDYLQLKNGYKGYTKKGMSFTARFQLTRRSLWQLLFDKVDNWMNPKIITNEKNSQDKTA